MTTCTKHRTRFPSREKVSASLRPNQRNLSITLLDVVLLVLWGVLTFFGLSIQLYAALDRPSFPTAGSSRHSSRRRSSGRSRSRRGHSRRKTRLSRRRSVATVPIDDVLVIANGRRSGQIRPSAPPTEHADESQPLLYVNVLESTTPERRPSGYNAI